MGPWLSDARPLPALPGGARLLRAGERGLVVELGATIDEAINARVVRLARRIEAALPGAVEELVPTYRSLLVLFDPLRTPREALAARIAALVELEVAAAGAGGGAAEGEGEGVATREVAIPVCYGGEHGPDLEAVAALHGLRPREVVDLHAGGRYRVYMLGFTPGFPYLGGLPPRLASPRLAQPRPRVPAGSVGIAGEQTGVYPVESPGGWRLLGRTPLRLFDPRAPRPFLLAAGDRVRFVEIDPDAFAALARRAEAGPVEPRPPPGEAGAPP